MMSTQRSPLYIGFDIGTQSVKCAICELDDSTGVTVVRYGHSSSMKIESGGIEGYAEQDPCVWINALKESVKNAVGDDLELVGRIRAVGVSGQQHGLVTVDSDGQIIRPCMLWCDTRSSDQAKRISSFGGRHVPPGYTSPKLLWLLENEPDNYHRTAKVMLPHDYINFYLSGGSVWAMECGDASGTGAFDTSSRQLDRNVLDFIHPDLHFKFPTHLSDAHCALGKVDPKVAEEIFGPSSEGVASWDEILIAPGSGDNAMTMLGVSSLLQATTTSPSLPLLLSLGTSGTVMMKTNDPVVDPTGVVAPFADATGCWLPLVCVQNCAMVPQDILEALSKEISVEKMTSIATYEPPGCEGLTILPYFSPGGERTPDWPSASGAIIGIRHGYLERHGLVYRASLEGVTCALMRGYQRMLHLNPDCVSAGCIVVVGGGANNSLWKQIVADVFQLPVHTPASTIVGHAAAIGAAAQAAAVASSVPVGSVSVHLTENIDVISSISSPSSDEVTKNAYRSAYERHIALSNCLFSNV